MFSVAIYSLEWKEALRDRYVAAAQTIRVIIQRSQGRTAPLSRELGINVKTFTKWRQHQTIEDPKTELTQTNSTALSADEETMVVAFQRHTLLP